MRQFAKRFTEFLRRKSTPFAWAIGSTFIVLAIACLVIDAVFTASHDDRTTQKLTSIEQRLDQLEAARERPPRLETRRKVARLLQRNTLALGVQFEDTSGVRKVFWKGTGFVLRRSPYCGTAAHVLEELETYRVDLQGKGLKPQLIAKACDGAVREITELDYHPSFPKRDERHAAQPTLFFPDIALFRCEAPIIPRKDASQGLEFCEDAPIVEVGEEIAVAGFPTEVATVGYPESPAGQLTPTIRFGNVERLSSFDTRMSEPQDLIQHNLPLVGGFSGAPMVNEKGQLVGITNESSYRLLNAEEIVIGKHGTIRRGNTRLLDAADMNFAVTAGHLRDWLEDITVEASRSE